MSGKNKGRRPPATQAFDDTSPNTIIEPLFSDAEMAAILKNKTITDINGFKPVSTGNNRKINTDPIMILQDRAKKTNHEKLYKLLNSNSAASVTTLLNDAKKELITQKFGTLDETDKKILLLVSNHLLGTESFEKHDIQDTHRKLYHYMRVMNLNYKKMTPTQRNTIHNILITPISSYKQQRPQTTPPKLVQMDTSPRSQTAMGNEQDDESRAFSHLNLRLPQSTSPSPLASPWATSSRSASTISSSSFTFDEQPLPISSSVPVEDPTEYIREIREFHDYISGRIENIKETLGTAIAIPDAFITGKNESNPLLQSLDKIDRQLKTLEKQTTDFSPEALSTTLLATKRAAYFDIFQANINQLEQITHDDDTFPLGEAIVNLRKALTPETPHIDLLSISQEITTFPTQHSELFPDFKYVDLSNNQEEGLRNLEEEYNDSTPEKKKEVDDKSKQLIDVLTALNEIELQLSDYMQTFDANTAITPLGYKTDSDLEDFKSFSFQSSPRTPSPVESEVQATLQLSSLIAALIEENEDLKNKQAFIDNHSKFVQHTKEFINGIYALTNDTLDMIPQDGMFPPLLPEENQQISRDEISDMLKEKLNLRSHDFDGVFNALEKLLSTVSTTDNQTLTYLHRPNNDDVKALRDRLEACKLHLKQLIRLTGIEGSNITLTQLIEESYPEIFKQQAPIDALLSAVDSTPTSVLEHTALHSPANQNEILETHPSSPLSSRSSTSSAPSGHASLPQPRNSSSTHVRLKALTSSSNPSSVNESSGSRQHTGNYTNKRSADIQTNEQAAKRSKLRQTSSLLSSDETAYIRFRQEPSPADHAFLSDLRNNFFKQIEAPTQQLLDPHPPITNKENNEDRNKELAFHHPIKDDTLTCSVQSKQPKGSTTEVSAVKVAQVDGAYHLTQENPFTDTGFAGMLEMASAYITTAQSKGKKVHGFEVDYAPITDKNLQDVIQYAAKMQTVLEKWGIQAPLSQELTAHRVAIEGAKKTIQIDALPQIQQPAITQRPATPRI